MESGRLHDEIALRLREPRLAARAVAIEFRRGADVIEIGIIDEGAGFDWRRYLDFDPERAFHAHGRGIAMARKLSFDGLEYRGRGNEVWVTLKLAPLAAVTRPAIAA